MPYECDYFNIIGCVDIMSPTPVQAQLELFEGIHTTYLDISLRDLAGSRRIVANGPSRTEALFAALSIALGDDLKHKVLQMGLPKDADDYGQDIHAVADLFRDAKQYLSRPVAQTPYALRHHRHDKHLSASGLMPELEL